MADKDPIREIAAVLPKVWADQLYHRLNGSLDTAEEIRMRRGCPATVLLSDGECPLGENSVTEADLREVLERATQASAHTALEQVRRGFVTLKGGHRIGLCGTVSRRNDETLTLRYLSSLSLRIARAVNGQAGGLLPKLAENGAFCSTLILGPPGSGKTTLLRELICTLSDGCGIKAQRVGVADERGEIAAMWQGEPQFYIGRQTDVLDGITKAEGISILLRAMNPQVLAVDEITHSDDVAAIVDSAGCGVELLATAHGSCLADLNKRPVYRCMMQEGIFRRVVLLHRCGVNRFSTVEVV